jgi:hypothetical protein
MPGGTSIDIIAWLRADSPAWRLLRAEVLRLRVSMGTGALSG